MMHAQDLQSAKTGWRPLLVVLDLDGTVVPNKLGLRVPPTRAVCTAIAKVLDAGVPIVVATGRSIWSSLPTLAELKLNKIRMICSNGAIGYDLARRILTHRILFDAGPAARALSSAIPDAGFAVEVGTVGLRTTSSFLRDYSSQFLDCVSLGDLVASPTTRLICRADQHQAGWVAEVASTALLKTDATWHSQRAGWLDIGPPMTSKATGVATIAAELGISADDVLAIGDDSNDVELFNWAGTSIAMGQASASVRGAATLVTDTITEDGVATALGWWFP